MRFVWLFLLLLLPLLASAVNPVSVGTAAGFAAIAATTMSNDRCIHVNGNLAAMTSSGTAYTGFVIDNSVCSIINGVEYSHTNQASVGTQALTDATSAYNSANGQACSYTFPAGTTQVKIALPPGVYCFTDSNFVLATTPFTLYGPSTGTWIFKITGDFTVDFAYTVSPPFNIYGGGEACNVFFIVGGNALLEGDFPNFSGYLLAQGTVTVNGGNIADATLVSVTSSVTLDCSGASATSCVASAAPTVNSLSAATALNYALLAGEAVSNSGASNINGNIGYATTTSGFSSATLIGLQGGVDSNSQVSAETVWNSAWAEICTTMYTTATISTSTLSPGIYCWEQNNGQISGTLTLSGSSSSVWVFQAMGSITFNSGAAIHLSGGATSCQVRGTRGGLPPAPLSLLTPPHGTYVCMYVRMHVGVVCVGHHHCHGRQQHSCWHLVARHRCHSSSVHDPDRRARLGSVWQHHHRVVYGGHQ